MPRLLRAAVVAIAVATGLACASPAPEKTAAANDLHTEDGDAVASLPPGTILRATADVNLRASGSVSAKVLDVVGDGETVTLLDSAPTGGFYHVSYGSESGWVSGSYVTVVSSPAAPATVQLVSTADVNLRSAASTSASVLTVVPAGTTVTALSATPTNGFYNIQWNGFTGYSSASFYVAAGATSGGAGSGSGGAPTTSPPSDGSLPTAAELLALTTTCNRVSNGDFSTDVGTSAVVPICGLNGAVFWKSDMDIDCNGPKYSGSPCNAEATGADDFTSARDVNGKSLDAATVPFIVVPGAGSLFDWKAAGLSVSTSGTSTVVAVVYQNKVAYAIIGDVGGTKVIGEGSYALAKALGINPNPNSGGVDGLQVTFIAFTGAAAKVANNAVPAQAVALGEARAEALLANP